MKLGFYAGRRVLLLVPVLLGVTFITFALTRIIPGDPISLIAGPYVIVPCCCGDVNCHGWRIRSVYR